MSPKAHSQTGARRRSFHTRVVRAPNFDGFTAEIRAVDSVQDAVSESGLQLSDRVLDAVSDVLVQILREDNDERNKLEDEHAT